MATARHVNFWIILIISLLSIIYAQFHPQKNAGDQGGLANPAAGFGRRGGIQLQHEDGFIDKARQQGMGHVQQNQPVQQRYQQQQPQQNQYVQYKQNPNVPQGVNRPYNQDFQPQGQGQYHQNVGAAPKRSSPIKISEHPDCAADVKNLCSASSLNNNFAVLDCLQNDVKVGQPNFSYSYSDGEKKEFLLF